MGTRIGRKLASRSLPRTIESILVAGEVATDREKAPAASGRGKRSVVDLGERLPRGTSSWARGRQLTTACLPGACSDIPESAFLHCLGRMSIGPARSDGRASTGGPAREAGTIIRARPSGPKSLQLLSLIGRSARMAVRHQPGLVVRPVLIAVAAEPVAVYVPGLVHVNRSVYNAVICRSPKFLGAMSFPLATASS